MSRQPIARSPDLLRLRSEGYDIDIVGGYLLVKDVPYVNENREIKRGTLISKLDLSGDTTVQPQEHTAYWMGTHPCHSTGERIRAIEHPNQGQDLGNGLFANHMFSAKAAYRDYHHKMTTYIGRITGEAQKLDDKVTAEIFPVILAEDGESVFKYVDTSTSRAGIGAINAKLENQRIGIVGLGGTGSYILDLVAKTSVREIHLFDGDLYLQHNAFRAPGSTSIEDLQRKLNKAAYWAEVHSAMRHGVHAHECFLDETNIQEKLRGLDFVFLCLDRGSIKKKIVLALTDFGTAFVEVGMGVVRVDDHLSGALRVTASTPHMREHAMKKMSFSDVAEENEYATNIQIADLNALNAALAVIRWKKLLGFYRDAGRAFHYGYSISSNEIINEDEG